MISSGATSKVIGSQQRHSDACYPQKLSLSQPVRKKRLDVGKVGSAPDGPPSGMDNLKPEQFPTVLRMSSRLCVGGPDQALSLQPVPSQQRRPYPNSSYGVPRTIGIESDELLLGHPVAPPDSAEPTAMLSCQIICTTTTHLSEATPCNLHPWLCTP